MARVDVPTLEHELEVEAQARVHTRSVHLVPIRRAQFLRDRHALRIRRVQIVDLFRRNRVTRRCLQSRDHRRRHVIKKKATAIVIVKKNHHHTIDTSQAASLIRRNELKRNVHALALKVQAAV